MAFLDNIGVYARALGEMPLREFALRAMTRVPGLDGTWLRREIALADAKGTDIGRMGGFLDRLDALSRQHAGRGLDIAGARVLEVGCGPLAGFAPLLFARGAARVTAIEPDWNAALFEHPAVGERYLAPAAARLGGGIDGPALAARFATDFEAFATGLEDTPASGPFDLAVSQSCLEHVRDLDASARTLARLMVPGARQAHLVNFGNHRRREHPFETIYEMAPADYHARHGRHINLARPSDVAKAFATSGLDVSVTPVDTQPTSLARVTLHPWWRERYSMDELAVRTAIVVARGTA